MKSLLMTAFIGSSNLGDQAIFKAIVRKLQEDKAIRVSAFTLDEKKHANVGSIRLIQTKNPINIVREIYLCNLLLIGGGGLIQDQTTIYSLLRHTYKALIAIFLGKRYMFYAVGVDKLQSSVNRMFARFILEKSAAITVRDNISKKNVELLGVKNKVVVTADPVLNLAVKKTKGALRGKPYIVVCLRHWFDINRYIPVSIAKSLHIRAESDRRRYDAFIKIMALFLDEIVARYKYRIIFLPFFDKRDDRVHSDVLRNMRRLKYCVNMEKQPSIDEAASLIGSAEFTIGMRLHSLIFSATQRTPFVALNYSQKVSSFIKELSLQEYGLGVEEVSVEKLKDKFAMMHANRESIKNILQTSVRNLRKKETINYSTLKSLLFSD